MEGNKILLAHDNYAFTDLFAKAVEECGYEVNVVKSAPDVLKKMQASGKVYDLIGIPFESAALKDIENLKYFLESGKHSETKLFAIMSKSASFSQTMLEKIKMLKPMDFISEESLKDEIVFRLSNILYGEQGLRKNYRALLKTLVRCDYKQDFFDAESFTISRDGMFLKTNRSLPRDAKVFLTFALPGSGKKFATVGCILYSINEKTPKPRISPPGAGLYFVDLNPQDRSHIDRHIKGTA